MIHPNMEKKYVSVTELAKMLGISRVAVFNKIKKGQIPAEMIGNAYAIPYAAVENLIQSKDTNVLPEDDKKEIEEAVKKVVDEYGETLKKLGEE